MHTVVVLAAGLSRRFGRFKQLEGLGQRGKTLWEYSLQGAREAGFSRVILVLRPEFKEAFESSIRPRLSDWLDVKAVYQDPEDWPVGLLPPFMRPQPWGTAHAAWAARKAIDGPFVLINADDFYAAEGFRTLADCFRSTPPPSRGLFALVAYPLGGTLSGQGPVSRAVCRLKPADKNFLECIEEFTEIQGHPSGEIGGLSPSGQRVLLQAQAPVSVNFWAFDPLLFDGIAQGFADFRFQLEQNPGAEYFLPAVVNRLIESHQARVRVFQSQAPWLGLTYASEVQAVTAQLADLVPENPRGHR